MPLFNALSGMLGAQDAIGEHLRPSAVPADRPPDSIEP
jgi:hypothetical protein